MKNLIMIIPAGAQQNVADALRGLVQLQGFTFTHVEGHGSQAENDPLLSARDKVVGYTPWIRVDILLEDTDVDAVLAALRTTQHGVAGQGVYWVTAVEKNGRF